MNSLLKLESYARLAMILAASLIFHLAVIFGVSWTPVGIMAHSIPVSAKVSRLTVTIAVPNDVRLQPEKSVVSNEPDIVEDDGAVADSKPSSEKAIVSTSLATRHFPAAELDFRPVIINDIPANPPDLLQYPQGGEVVLRLWIDEAGKVTNVDTISSTLPQVFMDSARNGFLQAVFVPGRKDGQIVASVMDVSVSYAPIELNAAPVIPDVVR